MRRNYQDLDRKIEELIVQMTAERNAPEIKQLYQDISDELRHLLVRKMGDKEQADEIAQNTYQKLCRLKHNRDIGDLRNYLFNMAVRLAINVLRKRESILGNIGGGSAYLALLDELRIEAMRESIAQLPDKTKYVFLLYRYRGCSYSTIASKLSISIRSVSNHIDRALENISYAVAEFSAMERRG